MSVIFSAEQLDIIWQLVNEATFKGTLAEKVAELKATVNAAKDALTEEENE